MLSTPACLLGLGLSLVRAEHPGPDFTGFLRSGAIGTWRGVVHDHRISEEAPLHKAAEARDIETLRACLDEASHDVQAVESGVEVAGICESGADGVR